jgi:hypothetical protein
MCVPRNVTRQAILRAARWARLVAQELAHGISEVAFDELQGAARGQQDGPAEEQDISDHSPCS